MKIKKDFDLVNNNTYKVHTIADYFMVPESISELITLLKELKEKNAKYLILGGGSNILFATPRYSGYVISLKELHNYTVSKDGHISAECGVMLPVLARKALDLGLEGLEWALGIPGTIGGSVAGNAGAYLCDIFTILDEVTYLDENLNIVTQKAKDIPHEYRHSVIKDHHYIVLKITMNLKKGNKEELESLAKDRALRRSSTQPLDYPNAGSVFRNPEGLFAGKLIEDLGLKGYNINGAMVSKLHANFIINYANAQGQDIAKLIYYVKDQVKEKYNIDLIIEQIIERG